MSKIFRPLILAALLLFPATSFGWNARGHMVVAYIAYNDLPPATKSKVDALLREHPDFARLSRNLNQNSSTFGLRVFMVASIWPDIIKGDSRFHEDHRPPTQPIAGFPSMMRHRPWHFIDLPFTQDNTTTAPPESPNALEIMTRLRQQLGDASVPDPERAYALSWLIHLVGDVHQPLHATARFTRLHRAPKGDMGGVLFKINDESDALHFFWDGALGANEAFNSVRTLANEIANSFPSESPVNTIEQQWIDDSFNLAKQSVYTLGRDYTITPQGSLRTRRPNITQTYRNTAWDLSRRQTARAARRLAAIIKERLP